MARGPKPAPTAIKELSGTRKDRINHAEPIPAQRMPGPPEVLNAAAVEHWEEMAPVFDGMKVLTAADGPAFTLYCSAYATWVDASKTLKKQGIYIKTPSGILRAHPALKVQQESARDLMRILAEFGGTPSSRSRLKIGTAEKDVDPLDEFLSK